MPQLWQSDTGSNLLLCFLSAIRVREGANIDSLFKLAFDANHTVFLDSTNLRSFGLDEGGEGIEGVQYVIGPVEDAEELRAGISSICVPAQRDVSGAAAAH